MEDVERKISARVSRIIKSNRVRATNENTQILMNAFVNLIFEFSVKRNWGNGRVKNLDFIQEGERRCSFD